MTSGYAVATLLVFFICMFFVFRPISIPTPRPIPRIPLNLATAPILAIALLWAARCIGSADIRNGIVGTEGVRPYNVLILFFSLAYMAITIDITGMPEATMLWASNKAGHNGWKLYLYFYVLLTLFSILLGNDSVVLSGTAILVRYTKVARLDPTARVVAGFAAVNTASMVLFSGNLGNVIICEGFGINLAAFTAYTILPFLACNVFCFAALAFQFRNLVPQKLLPLSRQDARLALLDPFGACVGTFMLVTTLILCTVVSFFEIDAWFISLPLATAKLLFDLWRDYYRYQHPDILPLGRGLPKAVERGLDSADKRHQPTRGPPAHHPSPTDIVPSSLFPLDEETAVSSHPEIIESLSITVQQPLPTPRATVKMHYMFRWYQQPTEKLYSLLDERFPTFIATLPRLPFALIPFAFSQFILIEALDRQGWVNVFADWLVRASNKQMQPTIWLIGILGIILCNLSGTNISATILLTKVVRVTAFPFTVDRVAATVLVVASNIGAVSFTFSASPAGLLWRFVLSERGVHVRERDFAFWNLLPLLTMVSVGLAIVSAEMAVLFPPSS